VDEASWELLLLSKHNEDVLVLSKNTGVVNPFEFISAADGNISAWVWEQETKITYSVKISNHLSKSKLESGNEFVIQESTNVTQVSDDAIKSDFVYLNESPDNEATQMHDLLNPNELINRDQDGKIEPIKEETIIINIGTAENPKNIQIGSTLTTHEQASLLALLQEFQDVFAWSYEDMPGIDSEIAQHHIPI